MPLFALVLLLVAGPLRALSLAPQLPARDSAVFLACANGLSVGDLCVIPRFLDGADVASLRRDLDGVVWLWI